MPKAKISMSMEVELILWIDRQVEKGRFKNRSAGIEHCVKMVQKILEGESVGRERR